ncbi:MAG: EAL domain-containing protein [Exilibacterium sp.]
MNPLSKTFSRLEFQQQLILTFSIGIVCLAVISSLVISSVSSQTVYNQLLAQGRKITDSFSEQSTLALLYRSPDSAREAAQATLAFPDVAGVSVFTPNHKLLFESDKLDVVAPQKSNGENDWPTLKQTFTETDKAWHFWAPVYAGDALVDEAGDGASPFTEVPPLRELVGFVHVVMSKNTLKAMTRQIFRSNLLTSIGLATLLLFLLLAITQRVSRPLKNLAATMGRAQQGDIGVRAELSGPKDIINMEHAFNTMMTELESREQELKRARDTALASARAKGEFAATVSHELRTPMNGVMGMLELLHGMGLNDKQEEYIKIARTSGENLLVLIDEILDFSKIESGKMKIHSVDINLREMLGDLTELLSIQARQKNLKLKILVDDQVPDSVRGDAGRIRQVLLNLTGNAFKFTESGRVVLRLSVGEDGKTLLFKVEDTGIGIPASAQQRIFEAFAQVDSSTTRRYGGTGLGLAICYQLVQLMGGKLGVESKLGEGSVFWFTLPLEAPLGDGLHDQVDASKLAGLRVIIVSSDTESCRELVQTFIGWESFQRNVTDGKEALRMLKTASAQGKPYDIVIIDTPIENLSPKALAQQVRGESTLRNTQIIVLCDNDPFAGCTDKSLGTWLHKSPSSKSLFKTISQLLLLRFSRVIAYKSTTKLKQQPVRTGQVLVVEDNSANLQVALGMLERLGHRGQVANCGEEALKLVAEQDFDLILMDCLMPGLDGYETSRRLRDSESSQRQIPIIAMTANVSPNDRQLCLDAGMDDYIAKPLNLEELEKILNNWLTNEAAVEHSKEHSQVKDAQVLYPCPGNTDALADSPAQSADNPPTLDKAVINKLREKINQAFPAMLETFINDTPKYLNDLDLAVATRDSVQIRNIAHGIKGSALNLGAQKFASLCATLEELGAGKQLANAPAAMDAVNREYQSLKKELNQYQGQDQSQKNSEQSTTLVLEYQPKILVVDDDQSARMTLRGMLERDSYIIFEANNGSEAVEICERELPDLVLMDAMMPQMDGFSACQKINNLDLPSPPPVLMVTALQDESSIEQAFICGATDFIPKPVNLTVLRQRILRMLRTNQAEKHVHQLSYYDTLTNLPNRNLFIERCKEILLRADEKKHMVALLFLDLDRFKLINDTQGHDAGDLLLKTVALRLQGTVRNADLVARLGGDEFTIVLDDIHTPGTVGKIAEKICRTLVQPFSFMQQQVYVTTSIGIALYPQNGSNVGTLMKHADTAMFRAKAKGGAGFQFYEYGMETEISRQVELESELRRALERDELILYYQPQADMRKNEMVGTEALVRWQHPQRGLLPPGEFIPLAEESGLIHSLGDWVLLHACRQQQAWLQQGLTPLPVAVNVSGRQLKGDVLLKKIRTVLNETRIPPTLLKLEITESTLADSSPAIVRQMQELKNLGVTLAIDDFGTGYSSLSYLKRFPVDTLKIDQSFIKDLPEDNDSTSIISGIIALGHSLGMKIIAEGVETEAQRDCLKKIGCDVEQGYLLSRPLPKTEFERWLRNQSVNHAEHGAKSV